jgi:hypothetical protein
MVSYSNSGYENDFFDVSDVYFNSTSQSSGSAVDLDELDARYLQKTGGTVSSNLIVRKSVDIKTALTLPIIGDVEDAIEGKQNELTAGTNITVEGDEVSCDLTAGTNIDITSGVISSVDLATTDDLDTKQDTISNFEINGNVNLNTTGTNFDTIVVRRPSNTTGLTDDYLIDLNELQIWVNDTNILVQNTSSLVSSVVSWSNKDIDLGSQLSPTNLYNGLIENGDGVLTLDPSPTDIAIIIKNIPTSKINDIHAVQIYNNTSSTLGNRVIGLAIELYNSKNDPDLNTILAQSNEILVRDSVYRFDFPSITTYNLPFNIQGILPNTGAYANLVILEVITPFSFPFNVIGNIDVNGSLILPTIGDVETTIQGKQNKLTTGANITIDSNEISCDLTAGTNIDITSGVISTTGLQNELTTGANITIDGNEISCDLTAGTNIDITSGVISTTGLATTTQLGTKQDEITTDTDLTLNSITTSSLNTSGRVGFDTTNIQFNTLVLRRPTGNDRIILNEIQVWVNGVNILPSNSGDLNGYFADWDTDKDTPIPALDFGGVKSVDKVYNKILEINSKFGTHSNGGNAMIIKDIPLTNINDIQSIVYYNRFGEDRAIGLVLELYNTTNDADLIYPLASSNVITTESLRYRFDFPSITSYSGFADENSINEIVNDTIALTETISLSNIEMTGNVSMNNDLSVGGSLFLGDTNLTEDIDGLLTLDTNKRLIINRLTSASVITGENNCDYLNTTFQGKFGIPDSDNDLTLSGTQINFNSDSFISNSAGSNSGNHLVIFVNGTEYKIILENAS